MSIQQLLQQVLQSGQSLVQDASSRANQAAPGAASKFGGFGGGALAGGALGLLLGNKKFRKMGGKFATYGGAAALGALVLKTYQAWQQTSDRGNASVQSQGTGSVQSLGPTAIASPALTDSALEAHSRLILRLAVGCAG